MDAAREIAEVAGAAVEFVVADTYDAVEVLGAERFDVVYTGIGALCWLPSIARWASVVARLLRPGGRLFIREGHPVLWSMCDPRPDNLLVSSTRTSRAAGWSSRRRRPISAKAPWHRPASVSFNHGLGEIFTALREDGLTTVALEEHREVPWNPLGDAMVPSGRAPRRVRARRRPRPDAAHLHPAGGQSVGLTGGRRDWPQAAGCDSVSAMSAKLVVLYAPPADPAAFDEHYRDVHAPIVDTIPGPAAAGRWRSSSARPTTGTCRTTRSRSCTSADPDALQAAFGSDQGKAAAADYGQIAPPGSRMFIAVAD